MPKQTFHRGDSMDFYLVLEQIMRDRDMSIPDIARATGLSDGTLRSAITRKQKNVALEVAFKISAGLGVSMEYLNYGSDSKDSARPSCCSYLSMLGSNVPPTDEELTIIRKIRALTPRDRSVVLSTLDTLYQTSGGEERNSTTNAV